MKVGDSVRKAIDDWEGEDLESSMLHASNAIDGTARKEHPNLGNKARFTRSLRDSYEILGPMGVPGIDLIETRFPVTVHGPTTADGAPDLADVIYGVHRCTHAHGDELPDGFELLSDVSGPAGVTRIEIERGRIRLSDRIIFGLLAVAILSPVNVGQVVPEGYYLSYGSEARIFPIEEWWGRAEEFMVVLAGDSLPRVKLDFGEWMNRQADHRT